MKKRGLKLVNLTGVAKYLQANFKKFSLKARVHMASHGLICQLTTSCHVGSQKPLDQCQEHGFHIKNQ